MAGNVVDWNVLAADVLANFQATGRWFASGQPPLPEPVDWDALAAQVLANLAATGQWFAEGVGQTPPEPEPQTYIEVPSAARRHAVAAGAESHRGAGPASASATPLAGPPPAHPIARTAASTAVPCSSPPSRTRARQAWKPSIRPSTACCPGPRPAPSTTR